MKTTTYICDKCKQSKSETDIVAIDTAYQITRLNGSRQSVTVRKDICKQCLNNLGLLTEHPPENIDERLAKNKKTFEDKMIDLLSDLGVLFEE